MSLQGSLSDCPQDWATSSDWVGSADSYQSVAAIGWVGLPSEDFFIYRSNSKFEHGIPLLLAQLHSDIVIAGACVLGVKRCQCIFACLCALLDFLPAGTAAWQARKHCHCRSG